MVVPVRANGRIPNAAPRRALVLVCLFGAAPLLPADTNQSPLQPTASSWPMFRGSPSLTGVTSAQVPDKPQRLWAFKTQGPVKSSPAISGGRVFIGSDDGHLYCLGLKQGDPIWKYKTGGAVESSPLVAGGSVFFGSSDGALYALGAQDGKLQWKYQTDDRILGAPNWFVSSNGKPAVIVGSYDYRLHCVDPATGRSNWVYETGNYINGAPAVFGNQTVFGGCDALLHVLALDHGQKVKEIDAGAYIAGSAAVWDGHAYVGHYENAVLAADLREGKVVWNYQDRAFPYFSSPAVTPERVVFGGRDKRLHCVGRRDGKALWTLATRGKVDSSPVICGNRIVVGSDDGRIYLVNLADGQELWSYEVGEAVSSSAAVIQNTFVIGGTDGNVYAFGNRPGA